MHRHQQNLPWICHRSRRQERRQSVGHSARCIETSKTHPRTCSRRRARPYPLRPRSRNERTERMTLLHLLLVVVVVLMRCCRDVSVHIPAQLHRIMGACGHDPLGPAPVCRAPQTPPPLSLNTLSMSWTEEPQPKHRVHDHRGDPRTAPPAPPNSSGTVWTITQSLHDGLHLWSLHGLLHSLALCVPADHDAEHLGPVGTQRELHQTRKIARNMPLPQSGTGAGTTSLHNCPSGPYRPRCRASGA